MLTASNKTGKSKSLFILRRFTVKTGNMAGSTCSVVRSTKTVKGQQVSNDYQVWTYRMGRRSCDCPATTPYCKHIDLVEIEEMRRCDYVAPVKARKVAVHVAPIAETVESEVTAQPVIETVATGPTLLLDNEEQRAFFAEWNARADECHKRCAPAITPIKTPIVRNVSESWLLNGHRNGTFSGRVAS